MLRQLAASGLILTICAAAWPAQAQMAVYCSGALQAITFNTQIVPGTGGRATYSMVLRNTSAASRTFQLVVTAPFLGRPASAHRSLAPGTVQTLSLGYQPNVPGQAPLRANALAAITRVSCF